MDVCFYYIRQLALYSENVKYKATIMDSHFLAIIKNVYHRFKKDPNVLLTDARLINDIIGGRMPLNCPWAEMNQFVLGLNHLMRVIRLWTNDPDNDEGDSIELRIVLDYDIPQQHNGHDYDIFVIKYAEYVLHNDIEFMSKDFDVDRARLDIAV
ncbi:Hypothetical predicted protein [Olea europaea subsp. europaea]|uniref:Uncharacterized protein n=1 Tax=Olea europaea subsp. europaea TaxID=158383 RepID=A0A8S0Q2A9_OLEEU|nr:Hypothetical predicted protein [Olea europaea subsp. europaea]